MTDFDFTADMSALHELIQMLYQGSHKFIVFSNVEDDAWIIHLALTNTTRWWKGSWTGRDLREFVVCDTSDTVSCVFNYSHRWQGHQLTTELAETLSAGLANSIVNGELHVGNWSADKGAEIYVRIFFSYLPWTCCSNANNVARSRPDVKEAGARYTSRDGAFGGVEIRDFYICSRMRSFQYSTRVDEVTNSFQIADYAQDKKCKLYPSPYENGAGPSSIEPLKTSHTTSPTTGQIVHIAHN